MTAKANMFHPKEDHAHFVFALYLRKTPKAKAELQILMVGGFLDALAAASVLAKRIGVKQSKIEIACYAPTRAGVAA